MQGHKDKNTWDSGVKALPQFPRAGEIRAYRDASGKHAMGLEMKGSWH